MKFKAVPFENGETLTFFLKRWRFRDLQRFSTVVDQRVYKGFTRESFEPNEPKTVRNREGFNNLHRFVVCMRIPTVESCLGEEFRVIKPRFPHFWVDSNKLGLGFRREKTERKRENERRKWTEPGCFPFI